MTVVFIVVTEDRHPDIALEVFAAREAALARAAEIAAGYRPPGQHQQVQGRLFSAVTAGGDVVYVVERTVVG